MSEVAIGRILVFATVAPVADRSIRLEKHDLRNATTDHERNAQVHRVIGDFHRPPVDVTDITHARALAYTQEIPAHATPCLHHRGHASSTTDELLGMA